MNRKSAPKRLLSKLWKWLKSKLVGAAKTVYLGGRKYLTSNENGEIRKVTEEEVDEKHRAKKEVDSEKPVDEMIRQARMSKMDDLHSMEVARRANDNRMIKADVLDNPDLVDAGSEWEAQLKLDLADGEDISSRVESNPKISEADLESALDMNWMAKWGDNVGDVEAMMNAEADAGDSSVNTADAGDADGTAMAGSTGETGDLGHASADGAPTVQASNVGSSSTSTGSTGSSTGTASSSGAGSAGNSAGGGHATGGGNSVSAASFSAGTSS